MSGNKYENSMDPTYVQSVSSVKKGFAQWREYPPKAITKEDREEALKEITELWEEDNNEQV